MSGTLATAQIPIPIGHFELSSWHVVAGYGFQLWVSHGEDLPDVWELLEELSWPVFAVFGMGVSSEGLANGVLV